MLTSEYSPAKLATYPDTPMHVQPSKEGARGVYITRQEGNLRWVFSRDPILEGKNRFRIFKCQVRPDGIKEISYRDMTLEEIENFLLCARLEGSETSPNYREYLSLVELAEEYFAKMIPSEAKSAVLTV